LVQKSSFPTELDCFLSPSQAKAGQLSYVGLYVPIG